MLKASEGLDHASRDNQNCTVEANFLPVADQTSPDIHSWVVGNAHLPGSDGQAPCDTQTIVAITSTSLRECDQKGVDTHGVNVTLAPHHQRTIDEIRERWRLRQSWHKEEKSLTLASRSMCRRLVSTKGKLASKKEADKLYDAVVGRKKVKVTHPFAAKASAAIMPFIMARDQIEPLRLAEEKILAKLVKTLPVAPYIDELHGVGILSLAGIVGEAGDLGMYANPAKLWKRMGLAVMPDGRQRKHKDKLKAIEHGYSPPRRSVMWNVGDCIVKAGGPLRELYDARKVIEIEKAKAEGLTIRPAAQITEKNKATSRSEGHIHSRAKRYVEKRVLVLLWRAWRTYV